VIDTAGLKLPEKIIELVEKTSKLWQPKGGLPFGFLPITELLKDF
jgi:hypothetical protein